VVQEIARQSSVDGDGLGGLSPTSKRTLLLNLFSFSAYAHTLTS